MLKIIFCLLIVMCPCLRGGEYAEANEALRAYENHKKIKFNCKKYTPDWYMQRTKIVLDAYKPICPHKEKCCDEILPGLYVGDRKAVKYCTKKNLVDRIVSFNKHNKKLIPEDFKGKSITFKKSDSPNTDIVDLYTASAKTILSAKKGVLIHCAKGHSRSASICILFLMDRYNIQFYTARQYVRSKRPSIGPKPWFVEQIMDVDSVDHTQEEYDAEYKKRG